MKYKLLIISSNDITKFLYDTEIADSYTTRLVDFHDKTSNLIESFRPDIIVCDFTQMQNGVDDFLKCARQLIPQVAVTILLDSNDKQRIAEAMKQGVSNIAFLQNDLEELKLYLKQYKYILQTRKKATA